MSDLFDDILNDVAKAQLRGAELVRDEIKRRISVPVDKSKKPWVRSKPGEPPRKDTGRLHGSIKIDTLVAGDIAQASVNTETPYAPRLQLEMDRPITTGVGESLTDRMLDLLAEAV